MFFFYTKPIKKRLDPSQYKHVLILSQPLLQVHNRCIQSTISLASHSFSVEFSSWYQGKAFRKLSQSYSHWLLSNLIPIYQCLELFWIPRQTGRKHQLRLIDILHQILPIDTITIHRRILRWVEHHPKQRRTGYPRPQYPPRGWILKSPQQLI